MFFLKKLLSILCLKNPATVVFFLNNWCLFLQCFIALWAMTTKMPSKLKTYWMLISFDLRAFLEVAFRLKKNIIASFYTIHFYFIRLLLFHFLEGVLRQGLGVAEADVSFVRAALRTVLVQQLAHQVALIDWKDKFTGLLYLFHKS